SCVLCLSVFLYFFTLVFFLFFFFFQAEDGIRDRNVTGVQTCALPILFSTSFRLSSAGGSAGKPETGGKQYCDGNAGGLFLHRPEIGRASCRERVSISVV